MTATAGSSSNSRPACALIVGAGRIGQALAHLIRGGNSGATVRLWDNQVGLIPDQPELSAALAEVNLVFLCVPSWSLRSAVLQCLPSLPESASVISLSKGLEPESDMTSAELLAELLPHHPWAVFGGPMIAEDLQRDRPGHGVVATRHDNIFQQLQDVFQGTTMEVELAAQPEAVALIGVVKNAYAAAVGVGAGLGWSADEQQRLFDRCFTELVELGRRLNIDDDILQGTAGAGDFITTASSPNSRNRRAGLQLGQSGLMDQHSEAIHSLPYLVKRVDDTQGYPILRALADIVLHQVQPAKAFGPLRSE